jgi:hypothetical protein
MEGDYELKLERVALDRNERYLMLTINGYIVALVDHRQKEIVMISESGLSRVGYTYKDSSSV